MQTTPHTKTKVQLFCELTHKEKHNKQYGVCKYQTMNFIQNPSEMQNKQKKKAFCDKKVVFSQKDFSR